MEKKRYFLVFLASLFVALFTINSFAAACSSSKTYTSCKAGRYLNEQNKAGNSCLQCPTNSTSSEGNTNVWCNCKPGYQSQDGEQGRVDQQDGACQAVNYQITYNLNGGSGCSNIKYTIESATFTLCTPTRAGYTFGGWYTSSSLTGSAVTQVAKGSTGNKPFYAKWTACTPCSTTYANTVNCSVSVSNNTCVYTTSCKPNYTSIANNGKYNAYCRPKIYTITLNKNGGTGGTDTIYEVYGLGFNNADDETISSITKPTRTGYAFTGYYTSTSGGTQIIDANGKITDSKTYFTKDTTIYAHWEAKQYTITANYAGGTGSLDWLYEQYGSAFKYSANNASYDTSITALPTNVLSTIKRSSVTTNYITTSFVFNGFWSNNVRSYIGSSSGTLMKRGYQYINAAGTILVSNTYFTANSTMYAQWNMRCPAGSYLPAYSETCTVCEQGYYCPGGTYRLSSGIQGRNSCGTTATSNAGSSSVSACKCKAGYEGNASTSSGTCTACQKGHYKSTAGNTTCTAASIGYYVSTTAATSQTQCSANRTTTGTGSTAATDCLCAPGAYLNGSTCSVCSANTYKSTIGSTASCTSCISGYTTTGTSLSNHDEQSDCKKTITLNKNGGTGTIQGTSGTANASIICSEGQNCDFGSASVLTWSKDATNKPTNTAVGGWSTSDLCYATTTSFKNPAADTYYACKTYRVDFDMNGGTGTTPDSVYATLRYKVPENSTLTTPPTRTGYTFGGWYNTSASTGGNLYYTADGTPNRIWLTTDPGTTTTLYARWTPNIYTITLYGITDSATSFTLTGEPVSGHIYEKYATGWYSNSTATTAISSVKVPTWDGFTFLGYYEDPKPLVVNNTSLGAPVISKTGALPVNTTFTDDAVLGEAWAQNCKIQPDSTKGTCTLTVSSAGVVTYSATCNTGYTLSGNGTSTPTCTGVTSKLSFNMNSGTSSGTFPTNLVATYGSAMPSIPNFSTIRPTKENFTFSGFYDAATGGTQYYTASGASARAWNKKDTSVTLYAHYTQNKVSCQAGKEYNGSEHVTCESGHYCPGTGETNEGEEGCYTECSSLMGGEYTYSDTGASAPEQCFTSCQLSCTEPSECPANSWDCTFDTTAQKKGRLYYRSRFDSCVAEEGEDLSCPLKTLECNIRYYTSSDIQTCKSCADLKDDSGSSKWPRSQINFNYSPTQCYSTCYKACDPQPCPENAQECVHGTSSTPGGVYYDPNNLASDYCEAPESSCSITVTCKTGYDYNSEQNTCDAGTFDITLNRNYTADDETVLWQFQQIYNTKWSYQGSEIRSISVPTRENYHFLGYYNARTGGDRIIPANGELPQNTTFTANATLYAHWEAALFECTQGQNYAGQSCPNGHYCPGGTVTAGTESDANGGCQPACPASSNGGTVGSSKNAIDIAQCYNTRANQTFADKSGYGSETCYWQTSPAGYTADCSISIDACMGGYWREQVNSTICVNVGFGAYSPDRDAAKYLCEDLSGADITTTTAGQNSAEPGLCYTPCPDKTVTNGTHKPVNAQEFYNGTAIPECRYTDDTLLCDTGYQVNGGECESVVYEVTLNPDFDGGKTSKIYLKYNDGWYSDSAATNKITKVTLPVKPGGYTCYGYDFNGEKVIDASGTLPKNYKMFTSNVTIVATYEQNPEIVCAKGKYYKDSTRSCQECPAGSYCPGVTTYEGIGSDRGLNSCAAENGTYTAATDIDGNSLTVTISSEAGSYDASQCFATNVEYTSATGQASGSQTCHLNTSTKQYTKDCKTQQVLTCAKGYYLAAPTNKDCSEAGNGYYSPDKQTDRIACPAKSKNPNVTTNGTTSDNVQQCYLGNIWLEPGADGGATHGGVRRSCYHQAAVADVNSDAGYTYNCDKSVIVTCNAGYWLAQTTDKDCSPVGNNYYSPAQSAFSGEALQPDQNNPGSSIKRTGCPDGGLTSTDTAAAQTQCYKTCPATIEIDHGTGIWNNQNAYYNNGKYDACKYTAQCDAQYRPVSSTASESPRCIWDDPDECPVGFYCPENQDPVECPADKDGNRGTTQKGAKLVTECFIEYPEYKATTNYPNRQFENGKGRATCWFQGAATTGDYTECRNVQATECNAGFWYRELGSYLCTDVDNGYYSPSPDINQTECPTGWAGSIKPADSVQKCYKNCRKEVAHATSVTPASETVNATSSAQYAECLFGVVCDTGYTVSGNNTANPSCQPNRYTITLDKNGGSGTTQATIQCTFDSGACEIPDTNGLTNAGYTTQRKWCTAKDGTGKCYTAGMTVTENISATGTDITLYAIWTPNVYEITLDDNGATSAGAPRKLYLKYATGWFAELAAVNPVTSLSKLPARDRYEFAGYVSGSKTIINSAGNLLTDDSALTFTTANATVTAKWAAGTTECAAGTYYAGEELSCQPCTANHYCPGGRYATDGGVDGLSECPDGGISAAGSTSSAACHKTVEFAPAHGRGTQVCYYNEAERMYKDSCTDQAITICDAGYWLNTAMWQGDDKSGMDCEQAEIGYYSPAEDIRQYECPGPNGNKGTTEAKGSVSVTQCFRDGEKYTATYGAGIQRCSYTDGTGTAAEYKTNCRNAEIKTCWAGYWLAKTSDTDCSEVGQNYYSETDDVKRQACPEQGVTGSTTTATSAAACYKASLEYVSDHGGGDQLCYWDPEHKQYSVSCGQRTLTYCHAGYYVNLAVNALDCIEVGYGYYSPDPDTKRQSCPVGQTTQTTTSGKASDCFACPAGEICTPDVRKTCATETKGTHPKSDEGNTDVATCWRDCDVASNAAAMIGRDYYSAPDTCEISRCTKGFTLENGACTKCPAGHFCDPDPDCTGDDCDDKKSCSSLGDGSWPLSETGAADAKSCYRTCTGYDIEGGKAVPKSDKAFWPNKCEYKGISDDGNPCDIVDGVCVVTSCKPSFEMVNGRCQACNRDHALSYKNTGNCMVDKCESGWHPYGQQCESDISECSAPNALRAEKQWDYKKNTYGICVIKECEDGYHISSNACVRDVQECVIEHGIGEKEWNHTTKSWGECVATSCDPGFTSDPLETNEPTKQCGHCKNKFGVKGELAASSYSRGCTISACMYQGEMYNLEDNECKPICDVNGYEDETGSMKWNPATKKCERKCKEGYVMW